MKQKLSNLIEFGADQGNVKRTVFYDIKRNKLFVGNSVPFPMIFLPGAGLSYATYVLTEHLIIRGVVPLLFSFLLMLLLVLYQFKNRREKTIVEVESYEIPKTYALIVLFAFVSIVFAWLYIIFGGFLLLFLAVVMWYCFLILLLSGQFKKSKYLKILEGEKY